MSFTVKSALRPQIRLAVGPMRYELKLKMFVACLLTWQSCGSQDKCSMKLEEFRRQFQTLNVDKDWQIYSCSIYEEGRVSKMELLRENGDTTFAADIFQSVNPDRPLESVYTLEFVKTYFVDGEEHSVHYDDKLRLQFHRKTVPGVSRSVFIIGKYNFQYLMGHLNSGQRAFYEMHRDSLRNVPGDNLPPLPQQ